MIDLFKKALKANSSRKWILTILFSMLVLYREELGLGIDDMKFIAWQIGIYVGVQGAIDLVAVWRGTKSADPNSTAKPESGGG